MAASFFSFCNRSGPGPPIQGTWLKTLQVRELGSSAQTPTTFDFARQRANPKHTYVCVVTTYESHTIDNQTHLKVVDRTSSEHFYSANPSQSSPLKMTKKSSIKKYKQGLSIINSENDKKLTNKQAIPLLNSESQNESKGTLQNLQFFSPGNQNLE